MSIRVQAGDEARAELERLGFLEGVAYMPVPRCQTCRWWSKLDGSVGRCGLPGSVSPDGMPSMLISSDDPGARLLTAADFGCVQYEPRERP